MPEAATVEAPPASNQSASGEVSGIDSFSQEIAASVKSVSEAKVEPTRQTSEPAAEPKAEAGEVEIPAKESTAAEAKPSDKPLSEWTMAEFDAAMKKAPSKAYKIYEAYKKKTETQLSEAQTLREKVKALESKPVESPGDARKIEAYENQIKELTEQNKGYLKSLVENDYSKSPEFKKQYLDKYTKAHHNAVEEIKQLDVTDGENTRQASETDFAMLLALPLREQMTRAKAMFGDAADVFFAHRNTLREIKRAGMEAIQNHAETAEQRKLESELSSKEEQRAYSETLNFERNALSEKLPALFGKTDNQEAQKQFDRGIAFAEKALNERASMSPAERAANDAVMQMTHAGYRRAVVELAQKDTELKALKAELENLRGSDPGKAVVGKSANGKVSDDDNLSIEEMALQIAPRTR